MAKYINKRTGGVHYFTDAKYKKLTRPDKYEKVIEKKKKK